jgi:hypothetical protein
MTPKNKYLLYFIVIAIITLTTGAIYANAAKDEIFYLCSNFSSGVEKSSVIKQLETANLSTYKQSTTKDGSKIVFSSRLYFVSNQCIIELDKDNTVISAVYI